MYKKRSVNREGLDLFFVYMHKVPNGKIYIGSSQKPFKRWNNGYGYIENKEFYNDITEYGWDNISHLILFSCQDASVALAYEKMFILYLDAENDSVGYNKTNYKETLEGLINKSHEYVLGEDENLLYDVYSRGYNPFYTYNIPISKAIQYINEWIYSERDRNIAIEKFINGKTHTEIAKLYNITERQCINIVNNISDVIERHI